MRVERKKGWGWKRVLAACAGVLILLAAAGGWALNHAIDTGMAYMAQELAAGEAVAVASVSEPAVEVTPPKQAAQTEGSGGKTQADKTAKQPSAETEELSSKQNDGSAAAQGDGAVTPEQAEEVKEKLTLSDKAEIVAVLSGSLTMDHIKTLQQLAQNGLTADEKKQAKALLLSELPAEDYDRLSALAHKYGISRGLTYEEAQRELKP